jgi:hypothetical protein
VFLVDKMCSWAAVDSRIKPPNVEITMVQTESEGRAAKHSSSSENGYAHEA